MQWDCGMVAINMYAYRDVYIHDDYAGLQLVVSGSAWAGLPGSWVLVKSIRKGLYWWVEGQGA